MHSPMRLCSSLLPRSFEQRAAVRGAVALPILIVVGDTRYNALLRNLSTGGAMIVTSAPMAVSMRTELHCGALCASGTVIWHQDGAFGIRFDVPISKGQVSAQALRSGAAAGWRKNRGLTSVVE